MLSPCSGSPIERTRSSGTVVGGIDCGSDSFGPGCGCSDRSETSELGGGAASVRGGASCGSADVAPGDPGGAAGMVLGSARFLITEQRPTSRRSPTRATPKPARPDRRDPRPPPVRCAGGRPLPAPPALGTGRRGEALPTGSFRRLAASPVACRCSSSASLMYPAMRSPAGRPLRTDDPGLLPDIGKFLPGDCDNGLLVTKETGICEIRRPHKARHRLVAVGRRDDEDLLVDERSSLPVSREDVHICTRQEVQRRSTVRWLALGRGVVGCRRSAGLPAARRHAAPATRAPSRRRSRRPRRAAPGGAFLRNVLDLARGRHQQRLSNRLGSS